MLIGTYSCLRFVASMPPLGHNVSILFELLRLAEINKTEKLFEKIKQFSFLAWQHISFIGNITFSSNL